MKICSCRRRCCWYSLSGDFLFRNNRRHFLLLFDGFLQLCDLLGRNLDSLGSVSRLVGLSLGSLLGLFTVGSMAVGISVLDGGVTVGSMAVWVAILSLAIGSLFDLFFDDNWSGVSIGGFLDGGVTVGGLFNDGSGPVGGLDDCDLLGLLFSDDSGSLIDGDDGGLLGGGTGIEIISCFEFLFNSLKNYLQFSCYFIHNR